MNTGVQCVFETELNDFIPHFILCGRQFHYEPNQIKDKLSAEMRKFGATSAIFTSLYMWRSNLISKEEVKQKYIAAHEAELRDEKLTFSSRPSVNNDLEAFCSNIRNPEKRLKKKEVVYSFLTQELTEEELKLVTNNNVDYAKTYSMYNTYEERMNKFQAPEGFKKSDDPDRKFLKSLCQRQTFLLHDGSFLARTKHLKPIIIRITILFFAFCLFIFSIFTVLVKAWNSGHEFWPDSETEISNSYIARV